MSFRPSAPRALRTPSSHPGCRLICVAALVTAALPALAQTALEPVVVTGSREPQPLDRVTADVVVIDAATVRASTADSVEDLLRREAGLQVSRNGGPGQDAGVFIRGSSAANTVVLVDGVRVGSGTLGQVEFESISLAQIDHIEVLRGPASSLYGADAVGGVVQIFTRRGVGDPRFTANAALGGYGAKQAAVGVSGATASGFDYAAALSHEGDHGLSALKPGDQFGNYNPDDDGYQRNTAQVQLGYTPAAGHRIGLNLVESRLNAQYDASEFPPPNFTQDASPDFRNKLVTQVAAIDYRGEINSIWTTSAQLAHNLDDLKSGGNLIDRFKTHRDQFTWQNALKFGGNQVVLAYEHLGEQAESTQYLADYKRDNNAFIAGYTGQFGSQVVQADLRHDQNSIYGGNTTGRLGWSMEVAKDLRVRALAGTTFRAPSFNDLFYPNYGVGTLSPERGRSLELGLTWRSGDSQAAATVYQNRVRDLIEYEADSTLCPADPSYQSGCARNVGRARLQGVTLSGSQRWGGLRVAATIDFLDAKDTDTGERLQRRAAHQESLGADYDLGAWSFGGALLAVGARPDSGVNLGSYATLDFKARWRFARQWQLEARLLNATNKTYEPARDYQPLGRQAWIGVRYDSKGL